MKYLVSILFLSIFAFSLENSCNLTCPYGSTFQFSSSYFGESKTYTSNPAPENHVICSSNYYTVYEYTGEKRTYSSYTYYKFKASDFYCSACSLPDIPFPDNAPNNTYSSPWNTSAGYDNSQSCLDANGTIENARLECQNFSRCKVPQEPCENPELIRDSNGTCRCPDSDETWHAEYDECLLPSTYNCPGQFPPTCIYDYGTGEHTLFFRDCVGVYKTVTGKGPCNGDYGGDGTGGDTGTDGSGGGGEDTGTGLDGAPASGGSGGSVSGGGGGSITTTADDGTVTTIYDDGSKTVTKTTTGDDGITITKVVNYDDDGNVLGISITTTGDDGETIETKVTNYGDDGTVTTATETGGGINNGGSTTLETGTGTGEDGGEVTPEDGGLIIWTPIVESNSTLETGTGDDGNGTGDDGNGTGDDGNGTEDEDYLGKLADLIKNEMSSVYVGDVILQQDVPNIASISVTLFGRTFEIFKPSTIPNHVWETLRITIKFVAIISALVIVFGTI